MEAPLEGIVLRYGLLYGPGTGFATPIAPGSVHVDAAAKAAELAVTRGQRGLYNFTETDGTMSSDKGYPSVRVGRWLAMRTLSAPVRKPTRPAKTSDL